jgi:hypothetical protein
VAAGEIHNESGVSHRQAATPTPRFRASMFFEGFVKAFAG